MLLVPVQCLPFAIRLRRQIDYHHRPGAGFHIQVRFFASAHATEEVPDVRRHHVGLVHRDLDIFRPKLGGIGFAADGRDSVPAAAHLRLHRDVGDVPLKLSVLHHNDGAFVAADHAGNVRIVGHRGTQHQ